MEEIWLSASFELSEAQWVTIGTVGEPGRRTFYLQARQDNVLVTLKLEKQQVAALATFLGELLADLATPQDVPDDSTLELVDPVLAEWAVGGMQLAYDESSDRIVMLAEEVMAEDPENPEGEAEPDEDSGAIARLAVTRAQAVALVRRGHRLVGAGRETCPLCGHPMDPAGHSCPRTNGHHAPTP
jgi:uncharacterized repeat protein (TIGR03847 family)